MPHDLVINETARWFRYAREDYKAALILCEGVPRDACLLAQQSTEKAIKSIYAFINQRIPKSHDLDLLKNLLPDGWDTKIKFVDLSELSFWAVESRYPGDMPEATRDDADTAIIQAQAILHTVEDDLHKHGFIE